MTTDPVTLLDGGSTVEDLTVIQAPWGKELTLRSATYDSGMRTLRIRIREGRARFTDLELDEATVEQLLKAIQSWKQGNCGS